MGDEFDPMWTRASALMGEHTCKEIIDGVWEHTFTSSHAYTTTQATSLMTADELLKIADEIKDLRAQEWLEDYDRYSRKTLLEELEDLGKPMPMMSYLRYCYNIAMPKPLVGLRPLLAEGTPNYALSCALPQLSAVEAHRAINNILSSVNYSKSLRRIARENRVRLRTRRQHRATFRRRKRGLA